MNYQDTSSLSGTDARSDTDVIPAGSKAPAVGNTITGSGTVTGASGADVVGSAPGNVVAVQGAGGSDTSDGGAMQVSGRYGVLNMDSDGSYRYTRNGDTPDGVRDVFTYTLADAGNARDTATLTIDIGREPIEVKENAQQVVVGPDGVVTLPEGVTLADINVVGRNLVINLPDGGQMVIIDGAVFVPQLVLGGVEVPSSNLAALLVDNEPVPAAGNPQSSGGNFGLPPGPLDPGVPLGDLIPPVEQDYTPPDFEDVGGFIDDEPEIFVQPDGQPAAISAIDSVDERGLPSPRLNGANEPAGSGESADGNGANGSDSSETTTGTIIVDANDTPVVLTITGFSGGAQVVAVGLVVQGQYGTLTITGVSGSNYTYSYTLRDNTSGNTTADNFSLALTDNDGDVASATLRIDIVDDVPTARPDTDSIAAGQFGPATGNVITDAAAGDAGDSDTNAADTVGADNAAVTSISSVNVAANSDSTFATVAGFSTPVLQVNGQYGVLTINASGDYSYTRNPNTPGGVTDTFNYTITDGDTDTSSSTLTISIGDIGVTVTPNAIVRTDDDAVPNANGNPGGPGDDVDAANLTGTLSGSGGDGALTFDLLLTGAPAGFTYVDGANGSVLVQQVQNGTTVTVLTVTINSATGAYTVTQNAPILHPTLNGVEGDNTENNQSFTINYTVTDIDNDSANGTLTIDVDDDTPVATQATLGGTVDEDGVPGGMAGGTGDVAGEAVTATGSVASLFSAGADNPLTYSLLANTSGLPALTSAGVAVTYAVSGSTLTASAGANTVFTFTLNGNGTYTFTLVDQIDHPTLNDVAGDNTENDLTIALGSLIQATDRDGDSVTANANGLVITVDDDTPTASGSQVTGTVDEDGVVEGTANAGPGDGIAGGIDDVAGEATVATGSVATLFNSGADQPLTYSLLTDTSGLPALTSRGSAVTYLVEGNTLTATANGETVFTLVLTSGGSWTFTLFDQIDHAQGANENDLTIALGSIIQATDRDGDSVTALANGLVITVDDDTPTASTALLGGTVDEDGVVEPAVGTVGDGIAGGTGDVDGEAVTATGNVGALFNTGADEPLTYSLVNAASLNALGLTSRGSALSYNIGFADGVYTLTATANGETVFTFTLNASSGAYNFTLVDQLDHPSGNNENDLTIQLGGIIQATDRDGDSVGASVLANQGLVITVDDDTPTASTALLGGTVDEDGVVEPAVGTVGDGIAGGTGDVDGEAVTATGNVGALFNTGADEPLTYSLVNAASLNALGLTSRGSALSYNIGFADGVYTLTATANGETVFTFTLNASSGAYNFTLVDQLDHPSGNNENDLTIQLGGIIQATDRDGDSVGASVLANQGLVITVDDDTPTASTALLGGTVDEDGVVEPAVGTVGDGIAGGTGDVDGEAVTATGNVGALFNTGADEPLTYSLVNAASLNALGLTSRGSALSYNIGFADGVYTLTATANGETVFTFTLNASSGAYNFTLVDQLDHPSGNNENDLTIQLGGIIQATDRDGDSVGASVLANQGLVITVDDDTPTASTALLGGTVDEDGVVEVGTIGDGLAGNGGGDVSGPVSGDVAGETTTATGNVGALFNSGADEPLTYSLVNAASLNALNLTSAGNALSYNIGFAGGVYTLTATAGGETVFTFTLNATSGAYVFTLVDQLDHAAGLGENDLSIQLGGLIQAMDRDGDTITASVLANQGLVITIDDDAPVAKNDTDAILAGGNSTGGNVITGAGTTSGAGGADSTGADAPAGITGLVGAVTSDTDATGGFVAQGNYGTLTMGADGEYNYVRTPGSPGNVSDTFVYSYTDRDGDTVTAQLVIGIEDNLPNLPDPALIRLDDDVIPTVTGNLDGPGDDNPDTVPGNVVNGQLEGTGGDGTLTYNFTGVNSLPTGFSIGAGSDADTLLIVQTQNGNPVTVMTIELDQSDGSFTVTQNNPIRHDPTNPGAGAGQSGNFEDNLTFSIGVEVEDGDNDVEPATITINVDDDTPTIAVSQTGEASVVLTTDDAQTIGGASDFAQSTANFSNVFSLAHSAGADGTAAAAVLNYTLDVTGYAGGPGGVNSGLESHDLDIFLYEISGKVVGSTSTTLAGVITDNIVFDVAVTSPGGVVTLTQYQQIDHDPEVPSTSPFNDQSTGIAALNDSLITLTASATLTDRDGDTISDSETANIGANLRFTDDGPSAAIVESGQFVSLDESVGNQLDSNDTTAPAVIALFAGVTNTGTDTHLPQYAQNASAVVASTGSVYGADGAGSTAFSLNVSAPGVDSGLNTTAGQDILLYKEGDLIVGRVSGGPDDGKAALAIAIDPVSGVVSTVEYLSIQHSNAADPDDSVSIADGAVIAVVTVTDFDGDTSTADVGVGSAIRFQDSAPVMTAAQNINIQNSGDVAHTGQFAFNLGADGAATNNDVITAVTGSATVGGVAVTNWVLTPNVDAAGNPSPETATTASYRFTFNYPIGGGSTAQAVGTLVFNKDLGTYTVDLVNPIQGVTTILQTAQGTLFQGYEYGTSTLDGSQPEISVTQIQDLAGTANDIYVQFTGVAEPSSGTGDNNLEVSNWVPGANNPAPVNGGGDTDWNAGQLFNQTDSWVSTSNSANGVAGDTIQGGEVLDFSLVQGANPTGVLAAPGTYAQASAMFLKFDGIGSGEDMIVILKLYDPTKPPGEQYTTRAIMVENGDIQKGPGAGPGQYSGVTLDQNDGLVIIEANDYNLPGENWVIVGAQVAGSDEGVTGTAINLNSGIGASGDSITGNAFDLDPDGFQSDTNDGPFKISSIGFLTTSTTPQNAQLDFNVTVTDGDGDSITQSITATVTAAADSASNATIPAGNTTVSMEAPSSKLYSNSTTEQQQAANTNTVLLGAIAGAGLMSASAAAAAPSMEANAAQIDTVASQSSLASAQGTWSVDHSSSGLIGDAPIAAQGGEFGVGRMAFRQDSHSSEGLTTASAEAPAVSALSQGNDVPAASQEAPAASFAGGEVAMPSLEALAASVAQQGGNAQAEGDVAQVLADALAGGGGADIDGLLASLPGNGGNAADALASHDMAAVSAWHSGAFGGFSAGQQAFTMESLVLHQDAVVQQA